MVIGLVFPLVSEYHIVAIILSGKIVGILLHPDYVIRMNISVKVCVQAVHRFLAAVVTEQFDVGLRNQKWLYLMVYVLVYSQRDWNVLKKGLCVR